MAKEEHQFYFLDEYLIRGFFNINFKTTDNHKDYPIRISVGNKEIIIQEKKMRQKNQKRRPHSIHVENDADGSLLEELRIIEDKISEREREIFVVYGRGQDGKERNELEDLLESWNLKPIFLDKQANGGKTIIEKLEENISGREFGIVLATPDDIGCLATEEKSQQKPLYRVRQNVLLEFGWLIGYIGRKNIIILQREHENFPMEIPTDINNIVHVSFEDSVHEINTKQMLAIELTAILNDESQFKGYKKD